MKKHLIAALMVLVCSGCAYFYHPTHTAYNRMVSSWVGNNARDLYMEWGYPQETKSIDDNTFLETYYKYNSLPSLRMVNSSEGSYHPFNDDWDVKTSMFKDQPMPHRYNCQTSFIVTNGVIIDYSYQGSGCVE